MSKPLVLSSVLGLAAILSFAPFAFAHIAQLQADLMGPEINGMMPQGDADWRVESDMMKRMKIDVEDVNLPDGTMLSVDGCGMTNIGTIELMGMQGSIDLREKNGDMVPMCVDGDMVSVMDGADTILSGTLMDEGD